MKTLSNIVFFAILFWFNINSLYSHELLTSAGGYFNGSNVIHSRSLGKPVTETFSEGSVNLAQGFQHTFIYASQKIIISVGWSGIYSFINPDSKSIISLFDCIESQLVVVQSISGLYFTDQVVNTISQ